MLLKINLLILLFVGFNSALETIDELCENFPIGTRIPHPEDCNLYLKCTRDNDKTFAIVISCQNGVFFNPNTLECDPDYESEICKIPNNKTTATTISTTTLAEKTETIVTATYTQQSTTVDPKVIVCPENDDAQVKFINSPTDCSKYYMCYHGRALPLKCWNGLHFSPTLIKCTPPEIAKCEVNPNPYPRCPQHGKTFLPHPNQCKYFFYCFNGIKTIQQCGSFDHWDIIDRKCKRQPKAICYSEHENEKQMF